MSEFASKEMFVSVSFSHLGLEFNAMLECNMKKGLQLFLIKQMSTRSCIAGYICTLISQLEFR